MFIIIVSPQATVVTKTTIMNMSHFIYAFESDTRATGLINYIYELSAKVKHVFKTEA